MPWVMSMISASAAIRLITPWQAPTKSSWRPKSERKVINGRLTPEARLSRCRPRHRLHETVQIVRRRLLHHLDAGGQGRTRRFGTDRDGGGTASQRAVGAR